MNLRPLLIPTFALLAAVALPALAQYPNMQKPPAAPPVSAAPTPTPAPAPAQATTATAPAQQSSSPETKLPDIPPPSCVAPQYPGRLAVNNKMNATIAAFNRDLKTYAACMKKYLEDNKAMVDALIAANNKAADDYNRYNDNLKKEIDASQD